MNNCHIPNYFISETIYDLHSAKLVKIGYSFGFACVRFHAKFEELVTVGSIVAICFNRSVIGQCDDSICLDRSALQNDRESVLVHSFVQVVTMLQ